MGDRSARRGRPPVGVAAAAGVVVVATALLGWAGLLGGLSVVAVLTSLVALTRVPAAQPLPRRSRPAPPVQHAAFPSYRQVREVLSWAQTSPRHYDLSTRPVLARVLAARLAQRHGVDLANDPAAAQALVGADVWPFLDPGREVDRRGQPPGVDLPTLERIVERLEQL